MKRAFLIFLQFLRHEEVGAGPLTGVQLIPELVC